jgi:hypothetical protein
MYPTRVSPLVSSKRALPPPAAVETIGAVIPSTPFEPDNPTPSLDAARRPLALAESMPLS